MNFFWDNPPNKQMLLLALLPWLFQAGMFWPGSHKAALPPIPSPVWETLSFLSLSFKVCHWCMAAESDRGRGPWERKSCAIPFVDINGFSVKSPLHFPSQVYFLYLRRPPGRHLLLYLSSTFSCDLSFHQPVSAVHHPHDICQVCPLTGCALWIFAPLEFLQWRLKGVKHLLDAMDFLWHLRIHFS